MSLRIPMNHKIDLIVFGVMVMTLAVGSSIVQALS